METDTREMCEDLMDLLLEIFYPGLLLAEEITS